jgi:nucleoside 2-deoxyribosyltransferase
MCLYIAQASTEVFIYERDVAWLRESDFVIAEVTQPSLGVGYELGFAEAISKPILCLYV